MMDLHAFHQAVERLRIGLARAAEAPDDEVMRDGAIQRFESTFQLARKMIKGRIEAYDLTDSFRRRLWADAQYLAGHA